MTEVIKTVATPESKGCPQPNEFELYPKVSGLLKRMGYATYTSFPHGHYSPFEVDVLGYKKNISEIFMVEVKLCHVNKAIRQGFSRLPYSDFVSLAFPMHYAEYVETKFKEDLGKYGFGLIAVNGVAVEMIPPKRSNYMEKTFKENILKDVNRRFG